MERQAKDGTFYRQVGPDDWEPVTRKAKDGTVYRKVGADDWSPASTAETAQTAPSVSESAGRGFAQGATFGFRDEAAGAIESPVGALKEIANKFGADFSDEQLEAYRRERDASRKLDERARNANPGSYFAGELAGGAATMAIPGVAPARGASMANIAARGVATGAASSAGYSEAENAADLSKDVMTGAAIGGTIARAAPAAQRAISRGVKSLAEKISPASQKINSKEIIEAARRQGIQVTPGMLDNSGFIERMESSLAKSPSFLGQRVARNRDAVTNRLNNMASDLTEEATALTPAQVGEQFKSGITAKVGERLAPISSVFDEVAESTKNIAVSERSIKAIQRNIENLDSYALTGGAGKPKQYVEMLGRLKNADQVKTMSTMLNQDIRAATGSERQVLLAIKDKVATLEKNSITRGAIESARAGGMRASTGRNIGLDIVGDLKDARANYRQLAEDLGGVAEAARIKTNKGPSAFLDAVEAIPSEKIQDKFFNVGNNRQLQSLRDKFPGEFELLRQGKLREIANAAVDNSANGQGSVSSRRFLDQVRKLEPEAKQALFGSRTADIADLQTLQNSIPRNFNPSGTASEHGWGNALYSNVKDIPNYLLYRGASSNLSRDIADRLVKEPKLMELYQKNPQAFQTLVSQIESRSGMLTAAEAPSFRLRTGDSENTAEAKPQKGRAKWASDGAQKLQRHGLAPEMIEAIRSSKGGESLLIKASDLTPGSKAMESLVKRIRSSQAQGGES